MRLFYRLALAVGVLAAAAACGSSSTSPDDSLPPPNSGASVNIPLTDGYSASGSSFNPGSVNVVAGNSVDFQNSDATEHNPTADDGSWNLDLGPGSDASHKFLTPGTYSYHCAIHPGMTGQIVVK